MKYAVIYPLKRPRLRHTYTFFLGDLGRHGKGLAYEQFSKKFSKISKKTAQVEYTFIYYYYFYLSQFL